MALAELLRQYERHLDTSTESFSDSCHTANAGRSHFEQRLALVAATVEQARQQLAAVSEGRSSTAVYHGSSEGLAHPKVTWLFPGEGSQYAGMAQQLFNTQPTFRERLLRCEELLRPYLAQPLTEVLYPQPAANGVVDLLEQSEYAQPALFALEYALAQLWQSWGLSPDVVLGHGVGELVAACVAGVFSLEDGLRLSAERGRLMGALPVSVAPLLDAFERVAQTVRHDKPRLGLVSSLRGRLFTGEEVPDAAYWREHARQPVRFADGVQALAAQGCNLLLELGPQPVLSGLARECLAGAAPTTLSSLERRADDWAVLLGSLAQLYAAGAAVDWSGFDRDYPRRKVALPTYPFQRQRYWLPQVPRRDPCLSGASQPLLGECRRSASGEVVHATVFDCQSQPFFADHRLYDTVVVPGATYAAMALQAGGVPGRVRNLIFHEPLFLEADACPAVQLVWANASTAGVKPFAVYSAVDTEGGWMRHADGVWEAVDQPVPPAPNQLIQELCLGLQPRAASELYGGLSALGLELGPSFQGVRALWVGPGAAMGEVVVPEGLADSGNLPVHPAVLDACTQVAGAALTGAEGEAVFHAPFGYQELELYGALPERLYCQARLCPGGSSETHRFDLRLLSTGGGLLGVLRGLTIKRAPREAFLRGRRTDHVDWLHEVAWESQASAIAATPVAGGEESPLLEPGHRLILSDARGVGAALAAWLMAASPCVRVEVGAGYERLEEGLYRLDPSQPKEFERLLAEVCGGGPLRDVVYLWGLDAVEPAAGDALLSGCVGVLHLLQALARAGGHPARLVLLTRGAQAVVAGDPVDGFAQAPLAGLARVIGCEHPELRCRCIDLDPTEDTLQTAECLLAELSTRDEEDQVAYRAGQRYVARLVRSRRPSSGALTLPAEGTYLITGGLGGLGLLAAQRLAKRGAKHVVLLGRNEPTATAREGVAALERLGATVLVVQADVSVEAELAEVLARIGRTLPPLRGIIHAAGILDDGVLLNQTAERFARVMAAKVTGAWHLHRLTHDLPLDFFVL
jgi:acyl transferase domain-containing protein